MGFVLHVRLTGESSELLPVAGSRTAARLLRPPVAPPPEEWPPDHPLPTIMEAVASLTPRVEPFSDREFFAGLDPSAASRLGLLADRLLAGPPVRAVLASSRLAARAAGIRLLLPPPPPGRGATWEQPAPTLYRILDPARFLAPLPLAYLWTLPEEVQRDLQRLGVWTIGQLSGVQPAEAPSREAPGDARPSRRGRPSGPPTSTPPTPLPQTLLVERLGATLARQLVEASQGIDPTPIRVAFPHPAVRLERSLPDGFDGSGLEAMLRPMAHELAGTLTRRGLGASRLTLGLVAPERSREGAASPAGTASRNASRQLPEPIADPRRLAREALRLAHELLAGAPPSPGARWILEADRLAPLQVHQGAQLVAVGGASEIPPALAELLEQAHRRFGQAAPVPASRLPISRRERMLRLWHGPR